ncbi:MAG TPA: 2'-5' RNA ligase family protein [Candidatus Sulfotelmatobacter sp.]|nr:2'-5' RNA ligase family protein [Candidatus Sulfotelmatobacter sp.]
MTGAPPRPLLAAVLFPRLAEAAARQIAALRRAYDPVPPVAIDPHVTLIFPTRALEATLFVAQAARSTRGLAAFEFGFDAVTIAPGDEAGTTLLYLVAGQGSDRIAALHERLHAGLPAEARRHDRPYLPHMTIGRFMDRTAAEHAAAALGSDGLKLAAFAAAIDVVRIDAGTAVRIATIGLAGS